MGKIALVGTIVRFAGVWVGRTRALRAAPGSYRSTRRRNASRQALSASQPHSAPNT
jgi:hypothetical protein